MANKPSKASKPLASAQTGGAAATSSAQPGPVDPAGVTPTDAGPHTFAAAPDTKSEPANNPFPAATMADQGVTPAALPKENEKGYWTAERISEYEEFGKMTNSFMDETRRSLKGLSTGHNDLAQMQSALYNSISGLSEQVGSIGESTQKIMESLGGSAEKGSKWRGAKAECQGEENDYETFKKRLCEEIKDGKPLCEPEEQPALTHFSLEPCDAFLDLSDADALAPAILTLREDDRPVTTIDQLKKYNPFVKVTICSNIELANESKVFEHDFYDVIQTAVSDRYQVHARSADAAKGKYVVAIHKHFFKQFSGLADTVKMMLGTKEGSPGKQVLKIHGSTELKLSNVPMPVGEKMLNKGISKLSDVLGNGVLKVQTQRNVAEDTEHHTRYLWQAIRNRIPDFGLYNSLMNQILGSGSVVGAESGTMGTKQRMYGGEPGRAERLHPLPFTNIQAYRLLKSATQAYLWAANNTFTSGGSVREDLNYYINSYNPPDEDRTLTPYIRSVLQRLGEWRNELISNNFDIRDPRHNFFGIDHLPGVELIWSYWTEQGMMVQAMNAISLRFQNVTNNQGPDPLAQMDIDPLRPLANLFWGYIQDEQHTLTIKRRAYEYDHTYGLQLEGRAVPVFKSVDSRSKFIEAFHNLLHSASIFFKESDDTTRVADPFSVLNNLREVHLLLAEGNHNAYGNLTWTARQEMLIQQYLLARPEMREFLGGRVMVPFREGWMDRVDRMRQIQNWGSTSITHYYDLAQFGEVLLLTIRAHDWSNEESSVVAGNWAGSFRNEIQRYIHSYRTVTGADLSADAQLTDASFMQPSTLIQRRLQGEQRGPLRNSRVVGKPQPQS